MRVSTGARYSKIVLKSSAPQIASAGWLVYTLIHWSSSQLNITLHHTENQKLLTEELPWYYDLGGLSSSSICIGGGALSLAPKLNIHNIKYLHDISVT